MKKWREKELELNGVKLFVTDKHVQYPQCWYFACHELGIQMVVGETKEMTEEQAKEKAFKTAVLKAQKIFNSLLAFKAKE